MTAHAFIQLAIYIVVILAVSKPLGAYMARVYVDDIVLNRYCTLLEQKIYRLSGIDSDRGMRWTEYALAMLIFNLLGVIAVFALQEIQPFLPFNPEHLPEIKPDSAFNTAISFATNTNWQGYAGESTMSYLTQMLGLTVQNFLSAATGMAVLVALIRGFVLRNAGSIGNFWVDLTRGTLYVLLPLSFALALLLASQGVVQTFEAYAKASVIAPIAYEQPKMGNAGHPLMGETGKPLTETVLAHEQIIALGPAASQVAIKQLGTNGGGFFNANSAHPFENPTPLSNFLEMLAILLIPAALCHTFGIMAGDTRQGWAILASMTLFFVPLAFIEIQLEQAGNPLLAAMGLDLDPSGLQSGGNMEGKETRFGIASSAIWAVATTAASNGSVNAMHDSFTALGGLVQMGLMQLGEVIYGGVGSGLYGMIVFAIVAVFVAGLMIGRTPEYLGKKIEAFEMKMAAIVILVPSLLVLGGTALAVSLEPGKASVLNTGAHGFSEVLYAFSSAGNNNGSAFAGLSANTPFYNLTLGIAMLISRYWLAVPVLAIAGSLAAKKIVPAGPGTLPTHTPLFVALLIGTVVMVGALTFVPALALGPVVEHLQMSGIR